MATLTKTLMRALAVFCLSLSPTEGYDFVANCVPGGVVKSLGATDGKVGLYVMALQTIMPTLYGNLKLMAVGPGGECGRAANLVNLNLLRPPDILTKFPNMTEVGVVQSLQKAQTKRSYLYVFKNKAFTEYGVIADCVPGGVVKSLSATGGRIALYTMALTTILPGIVGNLLYLGEGNNSACIKMMNTINMGNKSVVASVKGKKSLFGMKEVGVMQGLQLAQNNKSYIYVFRNKMWNGTWDVMIPNLQHYGASVAALH